jgi:hypothetical protein
MRAHRALRDGPNADQGGTKPPAIGGPSMEQSLPVASASAHGPSPPIVFSDVAEEIAERFLSGDSDSQIKFMATVLDLGIQEWAVEDSNL